MISAAMAEEELEDKILHPPLSISSSSSPCRGDDDNGEKQDEQEEGEQEYTHIGRDQELPSRWVAMGSPLAQGDDDDLPEVNSPMLGWGVSDFGPSAGAASTSNDVGSPTTLAALLCESESSSDAGVNSPPQN